MKKLILLLLFVMLVFSCQSIVDNIIEITTGYSSVRIQYNFVFREQMTSDGDPCDRSQESGFVQEKFCTSCGSSGKYVIIDGFSARGMSEKVFVERGWDWKNKIYYNENPTSRWPAVVKFNNQEYINTLDEMMFVKELGQYVCSFNKGRTRDNANRFEKRYNESLNEMLAFCKLNKKYFNSELIVEITDVIKQRIIR